MRGRCVVYTDPATAQQNIVKCMMVLCRVWTVRYNHFHDQLVLTSSSDSRVILNNVASISSELYGQLLEDDAEDDDDDSDKK